MTQMRKFTGEHGYEFEWLELPHKSYMNFDLNGKFVPIWLVVLKGSREESLRNFLAGAQ